MSTIVNFNSNFIKLEMLEFWDLLELSDFWDSWLGLSTTKEEPGSST